MYDSLEISRAVTGRPLQDKLPGSQNFKEAAQREGQQALIDQEQINSIKSKPLHRLISVVDAIVREGGIDNLHVRLDKDEDGLVTNEEIAAFLGNVCGIRGIDNFALKKGMQSLIEIMEERWGVHDLNGDGVPEIKPDGQLTKQELRMLMLSMAALHHLLTQDGPDGELARKKFRYDPKDDNFKSLAAVYSAWRAATADEFSPEYADALIKSVSDAFAQQLRKNKTEP